MLAGSRPEQINKRRADAARELDYHRWKKSGAMIHISNPVEAGQIVPAMIVAVWGDTPKAPSI